MGPLTVTCTLDPERFVERAGPMLLQQQVEHSVLLTRSAQALEQAGPDVGAGPDVESDLWLWVEDDRGQGPALSAGCLVSARIRHTDGQKSQIEGDRMLRGRWRSDFCPPGRRGSALKPWSASSVAPLQ